MNINIKKIITAGTLFGVSAFLFAHAFVAHADSTSTNFETFSPGSVQGQQGWGGDGTPVNPTYDQAVTSTTVTGFGAQALRISDAVTSGSFGDWIFASPLTDAAGEPSSTASTFSVGTLQSHFEVSFDFASTLATQQPGLHVSISPDRGDGSRMSYLRLEDGVSGINVFFDDYVSSGTPNSDTFNDLQVASNLDRTVKHTAKLVMDFVPGPSNDVVKVYIDGALVHTGTSWEDYYRYDSEANAEQSPRVIKTIIMQARGTATPADQGKGFLFDNISLLSSTPPPAPTTVTVTLAKYVNGQLATVSSTGGASFPMTSTWNASNIGAGTGTFTLGPTGFNNTTSYEATTANMTTGASYSAVENLPTTCTSTQQFALQGYSTGATLAAAASGTISLTTPSFTNLTSNAYIVVWNNYCLAAPTLLNPPNGAVTTTAGLTSVSWSTVTDGAGGITYVYQAANTSSTNPDGSLVSPVFTSGALSTTTLPTPGTPAGVYFWHVQAKDAANNMSPWSTLFMFTVNNSTTTTTSTPPTSTAPRVAKQNLLTALIALQNATTNKHDNNALNEAKICLQNSLNSKWWIDNSHVSSKKGQGSEVFFNEECTALYLKNLIADHKGSINTSTLQGFINGLVADDRSLATTAIADAVAANGNHNDIANANFELDQADTLAGHNHPVMAIDHYEPAWEWALKAL